MGSGPVNLEQWHQDIIPRRIIIVYQTSSFPPKWVTGQGKEVRAEDSGIDSCM